MILTNIFSLLLRLSELAFSAVAAGLTAQYLHTTKDDPSWSKGRFISTAVVASIGILSSLLFFCHLRRASSIGRWICCFIWWRLGCWVCRIVHPSYPPQQHVNQHVIEGESQCSRFKADVAFCFLASIFFWVSALVESSSPKTGFKG
ncbi:integral membrane protein [Rutstroemia sp. NJR-2017a WRK4]|nr:integral membrane protein [Rutstroemia sp. NJR-2017a WRK4]